MSETLLAGAASAAGTEPAAPSTDAGTTPAAPAAGSDAGAGTGDGGAASGEPPKPAVPESYDFKVPGGVTLDASLVDEFTPIAKELGLTQDQAQKVVDLHTAAIAKVEGRIREQWSQTQEQWREASKGDAEIGGAKLAETVTVAKKALEKFGTPGLVEVLESTGLGNHPEVIRFVAKIGRSVSEDALAGMSSGEAPNPLKAMYPSMFKS